MDLQVQIKSFKHRLSTHFFNECPPAKTLIGTRLEISNKHRGHFAKKLLKHDTIWWSYVHLFKSVKTENDRFLPITGG